MTDIVAALDADVLVPILGCDFLLTAFDLGLYEPVVAETVLEEVRRALSEDFPNLESSAIAYRVESMSDVLGDHLIAASTDLDDRINAKDRHVVAAAVEGGASVLVSNDRQLRAEVQAHLRDVTAVDLDRFALMLWEREPDATSAVIDALVDKRTRPAIARERMLDSFAPVLPSLVEALGS